LQQNEDNISSTPCETYNRSQVKENKQVDVKVKNDKISQIKDENDARSYTELSNDDSIDLSS